MQGKTLQCFGYIKSHTDRKSELMGVSHDKKKTLFQDIVK